LPPQQFVQPIRSGRRTFRPSTRYRDYESQYIVDRSTCVNSRGYKVPHCKREHHKNSLFVRTAFEWIITQQTLLFVLSQLRSSDIDSVASLLTKDFNYMHSPVPVVIDASIGYDNVNILIQIKLIEI